MHKPSRHDLVEMQLNRACVRNLCDGIKCEIVNANEDMRILTFQERSDHSL